MFENMPKRFKNPYLFAFAGFILAQLIPLISSLISGKDIRIGCSVLVYYVDKCYSVFPTNSYEWGSFTGRTFVWVLGALLVYWWEIGRKSSTNKN